MSELPNGWADAKLADLGRWWGGGTPSKSRLDFWTGGTIPWVSPKDMKTDLITDSEDHITEAAVAGSATNVVPAGSVLAVTRSGILRRTFPVAVASTDVALNQDLKALVPAGGVSPRYVAFALRWQEREILHECSKDGTTVDSIDFPALLSKSVPIAPSNEQERIVAAIEEQFPRLDAGISALERVRHKIKLMRAAVLNRLLRDEDGADFPRVALGEVLMRGRYGTSTKCSATGKGLPVLRIPNVQSGTITLSDLKYAVDQSVNLDASQVAEGDILIIRTNGSRSLIGRAAVVPQFPYPVAFASYLIQLRIDPATVNPAYLIAALAAPNLRTRIEALAATTAGQYNINLDKLRSLRIPLPSMDKQIGALTLANRSQSMADRLDQEVVQSLSRTNRLRSSILATAFSGGLVPQDPSDEPAAVLLERIVTDRASSTSSGPRRSYKARSPREKVTA